MVSGVREFRRDGAGLHPADLDLPGHNRAGVGLQRFDPPRPTAIATEGERLRFIATNNLPEATTVHFHGMHQPNDNDGVAGISQPTPIAPGQIFTYEFTPGHPGFFAYHAHTSDAKQEAEGRGGDLHHPAARRDTTRRAGLPVHTTVVLLQHGRPAGGPEPAGRRVQLPRDERQDARRRVRAGSQGWRACATALLQHQLVHAMHAMHQHGADMVIVSQNGHAAS